MAFGIESFLLKIFLSILKSSFPSLAKGIEIYSAYQASQELMNVVNSFNDCHDLSTHNLHVFSDHLTDIAMEEILDCATDHIMVRETKSGLYVASKVAPEFNVPGYPISDRRGKKIWGMISGLEEYTYAIGSASSWSELEDIGPRWQRTAENISEEFRSIGISTRDEQFKRTLEAMDVTTSDYRIARDSLYKMTSLVTQYYRNKLLGLRVDHLY